MDISLDSDGSFLLHTGGRCQLSIPVSSAGALAIANILRERSYEGDQRIGTAAFPTQAQLDRWLATEGRRRSEEALAQKRVEALEKLGVSDADLAGLDIEL